MSKDYNLVSILSENGINASLPRIEILEFLYDNRIHPTVDDIYSNLSKRVNSLSKATVYNTLELFSKKGIVNNLYIENNEVRYDIRVESHGHFKCVKCGKVYDVEIYNLDSELTKSEKDFKVLEEEINYRGICSDCQLKINKE